MKQIKRFGTLRLHNNEFLSYTREVEEAILNATAEALNIVDNFIIYQQKLQEYDDCIVQIRGNVLSKEMIKANAERNDLFIGISEQIRTARRHFDPDKKRTAKALIPIVRAFQGSNTKGYDEKSGLLSNLVEKYRTEPYRTHIEALNLTEWVDHLEEANMKCIDLTRERTLQTGHPVRGIVLKTRKELRDTYTEMVRMLNALALVHGEDAYAGLFDYINARIAHYRTIIARRRGSSDKPDTESPESPESPEEAENR